MSISPIWVMIVGEVITRGEFKGTTMPENSPTTYVDGTSYTIKGEEGAWGNIVSQLKIISSTLGLDINWNKLAAYWHSPIRDKPTWLYAFQWKWANGGELFKLLDTVSGWSLEIWANQSIHLFLFGCLNPLSPRNQCMGVIVPSCSSKL